MKLCEMHDLSCVVHLHSTHSDGTGTVPEIARAAARARPPTWCCSQTTTRSRRSGTARRAGTATCCCWPARRSRRSERDHYLAFGIDTEIRHRGLDACGIVRAVRDAGGFGFAAHPFSEGSAGSERPGMPFGGLDCEELDGIELWNMANDAGEQLGSIPAALRFLAMPARVLDHPPERNMRAWDELCRERRVVAIGGLDAHQYGKRIGPFVPVRVMSYRRSFRLVRTHVLCEAPPARELERDRGLVYDALRAGRCYIAVEAVAPARGFRFEGADLPMGAEAPAGRCTLHVRTPLPARIRLIRDGTEIATGDGTTLDAEVEEPGVYRAEALRRARGRERTWIVSNPIYLR
jgi:hypothetical protein